MVMNVIVNSCPVIVVKINFGESIAQYSKNNKLRTHTPNGWGHWWPQAVPVIPPPPPPGSYTRAPRLHSRYLCLALHNPLQAGHIYRHTHTHTHSVQSNDLSIHCLHPYQPSGSSNWQELTAAIGLHPYSSPEGICRGIVNFLTKGI